MLESRGNQRLFRARSPVTGQVVRRELPQLAAFGLTEPVECLIRRRANKAPRTASKARQKPGHQSTKPHTTEGSTNPASGPCDGENNRKTKESSREFAQQAGVRSAKAEETELGNT